MKSHTTLIILLFIYLTSPLYAQQLGFSISSNKKKVEIPFEIYNNLIVVPVVLNNELPLKFILDTGVRTSILTEKAFGDIINLSYSKKYTISGLGGEQLIDAYITNNVSINLPGVKGRGHALLVLAEDYLELRNYLGTDVHGILGYELFSRFVVKIDYDRKIMLLTTPKHFKPGRKYREIPMEVHDTKPYITGQIIYGPKEVHKARLMVDSGASHGLRLEPNEESDIYIPQNNINAILGRGLGGVMKGKIARIPMLQLNNKICWENVITSFPDDHDFLDSLKTSGSDRNGSIGGEILSRFITVFDFPDEKLFLKPGKDYKDRFSYNMSGLTVKAKGSLLSTFEIVEVRKNSSGENAGIEKGDIILKINGMQSGSLHLNVINSILNSKENKKIKLVIQRNDKKLAFKFRLHSLI
ncbi:aspartyl protease family protein [Fulvivirga sediminis]|uniref:Aspartyl protease family protein n=1 Tax=Fulvivirga sediminis TaxID=2803949 RepID=A0A937JYX8_9BACT|nr:aspartyl protease family protein [Fulvivirga sediminis]MBL3654700.1 aspartyl protease family protein [Fulvivirga sediminis]